MPELTQEEAFRWKITVRANAKEGSIAGYARADSYWAIQIYRRAYKAHRLAWFMMYGYWPKEIDHINRDKRDNRILNLREVTRSINLMNRSEYKVNKLGVRGVHKKGKRYAAQYQFDGNAVWIGTYDTVDEASLAYRAAVKALEGSV